MRKIYICIFVLLIFISQNSVLGQPTLGLDLEFEKSFCELPLGNSKQQISIPYKFKGNAESRTLNFTINYLTSGMLNGNTCSTWPTAAQTAFTYAMSIWSDALESTQNIGVDACWTESLATNTLGSAGSNGVQALNVSGLPTAFYSIALAEYLAAQQIKATDINASFNANRTDWYFGTDANPPFNEIDFVSVVLHELGHGLGFFGAKDIDDGIIDIPNNNFQECDGVDGHGCIGFYAPSLMQYVPTIYDIFIDIDDETQIMDVDTSSVDIANLLIGMSTTGGAGGLEFDETNSSVFRTHGYDIHTPGTYVPGSSYSHFSETTFPNELMSPSISAGQGIHDLGMSLSIMAEMGWSQAIVPVELISFNAFKNGRDVLLNWKTETEIDNDYFSVERSTNGHNFESLGLVKGNGTLSTSISYEFVDRDPETGSNYYRLKQVDYGGEVEISDIIQFDFNPERANTLLSPNPAFNEITLDFYAQEDNPINISIFSFDGRKIKEQKWNKLSTNTIDVSIQDIPKGNYLVRIQNGLEVETLKFNKI